MKYYFVIKGNNIICGLNTEDITEKPQIKEEYIEVTEKQHKNIKCCSIINGEIIFDEDQADYDIALKECYNNRRREYGTILDQLDEMFHSRDDWKNRISTIKVCYPKPIK